jgi:hypothetical protein
MKTPPYTVRKVVRLEILKRHKGHEMIYDDIEAEVEHLIKSFNKVGITDTIIIINNKNEVLSGWVRVLAMLRMGIEEVSVLIVDLTKSDELEYIIAHNSQRKKSVTVEKNEIVALYHHYSPGQGSRNHSEPVDTNQKVADLVRLSKSRVISIRKINERCPLLFNLIDNEGISISRAEMVAKVVSQTEYKERTLDELRDYCQFSCPHQLSLLVNGKATLQQALKYSARETKKKINNGVETFSSFPKQCHGCDLIKKYNDER